MILGMDEKNTLAPVAREPPSRLSRAFPPTMSSPTQRHMAMEYNDAAYNPGALPRTPLRIPQKNPRRSLGPSSYPATCVPSSPASTIASTGHLSPPYKADSTGGELDREDGAAPPEANQVDEKHWFAHRNRSRRFLATVGIVTFIIIVGLAVGLTLGLRNK
jgi:hypothetical protein